MREAEALRAPEKLSGEAARDWDSIETSRRPTLDTGRKKRQMNRDRACGFFLSCWTESMDTRIASIHTPGTVQLWIRHLSHGKRRLWTWEWPIAMARRLKTRTCRLFRSLVSADTWTLVLCLPMNGLGTVLTHHMVQQIMHKLDINSIFAGLHWVWLAGSDVHCLVLASQWFLPIPHVT